MRLQRCTRLAGAGWLAATIIILGAPASARGQDQPTKTTVGVTPGQTQTTTVAVTPAEKKPSLEVYGFAMLDIGHDFNQIDPDWYDTLRLTKLPSTPKQFGEDNNTFAGVRQSRLGVQRQRPDRGRRTEDHLRVRAVRHRRRRGTDHVPPASRMGRARAQFGAGQTWSPFIDPDVFPNSLEYWGPTGLPCYRNVQVR